LYVYWSGSAVGSNGWIGIYKNGTSNSTSGNMKFEDYEWVNSFTNSGEGHVNMNTPSNGNWELRLFQDEKYTHLLVTLPFTVEGCESHKSVKRSKKRRGGSESQDK